MNHELSRTDDRHGMVHVCSTQPSPCHRCDRPGVSGTSVMSISHYPHCHSSVPTIARSSSFLHVIFHAFRSPTRQPSRGPHLASHCPQHSPSHASLHRAAKEVTAPCGLLLLVWPGGASFGSQYGSPPLSALPCEQAVPWADACQMNMTYATCRMICPGLLSSGLRESLTPAHFLWVFAGKSPVFAASTERGRDGWIHHYRKGGAVPLSDSQLCRTGFPIALFAPAQGQLDSRVCRCCMLR
jgi:hypothetical protein